MDNLSQIQGLAATIAREHAQMQKLFAPSLEFARTLEQLRLPELRLARDLAAAMYRNQSLFTEISRTSKVMEDITRQVAASSAFVRNIVPPSSKLYESLREQSLIFENLTARLAKMDTVRLTIPQISRSSLAWECTAAGLANRMHEIGLFAQRDVLANRLFAAPRAYSEFVQRTTDLLGEAPSEKVAKALRGSMSLAENQLLGISGSLSEILSVPEDTDVPSAARALDAPLLQQDELLASEALVDEDDADCLAAASETGGFVELSKEVLHLVALCNEAGKTSTGTEIFKPTTRLLEVFADLPWLVAMDRKQLAEIIDCLYFIFYEGAGRDKLRFMTQYGGPLEDSDCDLIWTIKHLRNKWTRHDADHGKEKDIQKSWSDLAAKFRWLSLTEHPTDAKGFRLLQQRLLAESKAFLESILGKLELKQ